MLSLVGEIWFIAISITVSIETVVAHHLQNVSGKSGWKVKGARFFGTFQRKIAHKAVMSLRKTIILKAKWKIVEDLVRKQEEYI